MSRMSRMFRKLLCVILLKEAGLRVKLIANRFRASFS